MLAETLPIYRDTFDLVSIIADYVEKFPKMYKYTLGEKMLNVSLELFEYLQLANRAIKAPDKRTAMLERFLLKFELLKVLIRLCSEKKILSTKQMAKLFELMNNIGKQATAWKNN